MKAAVYYGNRDLRVEDVAEPAGDLEPHQVLLDVAACGICGTDLHEYADGPLLTSPTPHPVNGYSLPQILGHELAGTVLDVGMDVRDVRAGDRVTVIPAIFCGTCHFCLRGQQPHCLNMRSTGYSDAWGGFAARAVVGREQVVVLPDEVSLDEGAMIEPAAVAVWAVTRSGVVPGSRVLITGAGPIGALAALAASAAGATHVYVSETNAGRRQAIGEIGATEVFDPLVMDVPNELRERCDGLGVDVAIECSGNAAALATCIASVRARGTVGQTGIPLKPALVDLPRLTTHALNLVGCWCWPANDFGRIAGLVASGRLPVASVISRTIGIDDIVDDGFENLLAPGTTDTKILVAAG